MSDDEKFLDRLWVMVVAAVVGTTIILMAMMLLNGCGVVMSPTGGSTLPPLDQPRTP